MASSGLKDRILKVLAESSRPMAFAEIVEALRWEGPREEVRRALADLVRDGRVERVPDYDRRLMVFRVKRG
jgi:DNA-binding IclR family transcriptional regulator